MSFQSLFKKDYEKGKANELKLLPKLRELFRDNNIEVANEQHSVFDYESFNKRIELKTRFNEKERYPTTMIPLNKVMDAENYDGYYYFVFSFTDKNCYIKYRKSKFDKFEKGLGGRTDRNKQEIKEYVYIPIEKLVDF